jgi:prolyl oligopeptidase
MTPSGSYPQARRADITETIHGHLVDDPYRWLEDPDSDETKAWLAAEDALYAEQAAVVRPQREALAARITELLGAGEAGLPRWRGERRFFTRRHGGQEHAVLYTEAPGQSERVLIDPMAIDPSGTTTLDDWRPDKEGRLLAYQLSRGGSEESVLQVMDVATGTDVDGPIDRCRYSDVAWLPGGDAFYYSRRLAPGQVPSGEEQYHRRVYLHRVGSPADDDVLIFGAGRDKTSYYSVSVSRDGRWLQLGAAAGTAPRNDLWLAELTASAAAAPALAVVQEGADAQAYGQVGNDGRLYLLTDRDAPRGRLVVADPASPGHEYWRDLVAQDPEAVLTGYAILDGPELPRQQLLCSWTRHAIGEITVHDLADGSALGTVALPGLGTVAGLAERPEGGHEAWISYTDHRTPPMVLRYDGRDGSVRDWDRVQGAARLPEITARQVSFPSADGTTIRMLVISGGAGTGTGAAGPAAQRPAILYGYGGFNVSLTPAYAPAILAWTEAGGVYAIAGLRGGSEEGEQWHRAGMRDRKQNVFDDFSAAAQALVSGGWTTSGQLAVSGGSNGGLLVGATITQHPQLCAAAICSAPLLDMVRYERFGLGESWNDEYGTVADQKEFGWLLSYSPYHHVSDGTSYPAVLFTVFDGDTRVDPLHARKLCAAMQHATSARYPQRPILLRREANVGHGARAVSRSAALSADTLAFASLHTGLSR